MKMHMLVVMLSMVLVSCASSPKLPVEADPGSCSVKQVAPSDQNPMGGSIITCPDGSSVLVSNGANGTNGVNGTNGIDGKDGKDGTNGTNGVDGQPGANGHDGANGLDGTQIQMVQFCQHSTGSYPSTFPEYGFCINSELWAVYSTNGGFLTKILPGDYTSNGVNSSCNFRVGSSCSVTQI